MFTKHPALPVKFSRDEVLFLMESGYLLRDLGRHQEALDVFRGVTALLPNNPEPAAAMGAVLLAAGQVDEALAHLEKVRQFFPADPFVLAHLGETLVYKKEVARAQELFSQVVEKDPQGPGGQIAHSYLELLREIQKR